MLALDLVPIGLERAHDAQAAVSSEPNLAPKPSTDVGTYTTGHGRSGGEGAAQGRGGGAGKQRTPVWGGGTVALRKEEERQSK